VDLVMLFQVFVAAALGQETALHVARAQAGGGGLWRLLDEATAVARPFQQPGSGGFKSMGHSAQLPQQIDALLGMVATRPRGAWRTICEIGFNAGHSALLWLQSAPAAALKEFDLGTLPWSKHSRAFVDALFPGRMTYFKGSTLSANSSLAAYARRVESGLEPPCELFFVDGHHTRSAAESDLRHALRASTVGSIVVGDDCTRRFPGVLHAFTDLRKAGLTGNFTRTSFKGNNASGLKGWCAFHVLPQSVDASAVLRAQAADAHSARTDKRKG